MKTTVKSLEGSRQMLFIGGRFVAPMNGNYIASFDPMRLTSMLPWPQHLPRSAIRRGAA
jgi:(Z)-2-((N-methylformamido)methylene)-5-hydroxybutyrolactone dehydrogenase